ncbi:MAG: TonB-dependent receptor [Arenicella sp.]|nr:TonB-dependent receptor [Arenicella sp.]
MYQRGRGFIRAIALMLVMPFASTAFAQLEEIVVTAQKRSESVQDVPISITVLSGQELANRGLNDFTAIAESVPNFDLPVSNLSRNVSVRIRGIGSSGTNPGIESSVGVFLDGLYQPSGAQILGELSDIQNVEILRGPQGTLYGRNTPVGAVNATTRAPQQEFESQIRAGLGSHGQQWLNGYVGGGLSDNVAGRLSVWSREHDGYEKNLFTGDDINTSETIGARGKLLFQPSENLDVTLIAGYSESDRECCIAEQIDPTGPFGIATPGFLAAQQAAGTPFLNFDDSDHVVNSDETPDDHTETTVLSLTADWELTGGHTLTSITGYQDWDNQVFAASDSHTANVLEFSQNQRNEILSQEFRLTSPVGDKFDYLAGLYLYNQETTFTEAALVTDISAARVFANPRAPFCLPQNGGCTLRVGDNGGSLFEQETDSIAVYANGTYHINDRWDITGGLRWSQDEKDFDVNHFNDRTNSPVFNIFIFPPVDPAPDSRKEDKVTWSINSRYNLNEDVMLFGAISTGFKSGGFNSRRLPAGALLEFEGEEATSYEFGIKGFFADRTLMLNATAYHTTVEDFQETALAPTGTGFIVSNAGEQEVKGVEADFRFAPNDNFSMDGGIAYLDAEYTDFNGAQCGLGEAPDNANGTCDRTGDTPSNSPKVSLNVGLQWEQDIAENMALRLRADYNWRDDQNITRVTQDQTADIDSYGLLNLRAALGSSDGRWELEAFVNNVADEAYFVQAARQPLGALITAGGFAGAGGSVGWYGAPRTYGLQLTYRPGL